MTTAPVDRETEFASDITPEEMEEALSREAQIDESPRKRSSLGLIVFGGSTVVALLALNLSGGAEAPASPQDLETAFPRVAQTPRIAVPPPPEEDISAFLPAVEPELERDPYDAQRELELQRQALADLDAARRKEEQRRRSPMVVFDQAQRSAASSPARVGTIPASFEAPSSFSVGGDEEEASAPERFAERVGAEGVETARLSYLANPNATVPQGTLIQAVLETAIQSDLPGFTRAQVSEDVYAFNGAAVVIPKGSRLIGRYQSGLARGQSRVFVIWQRILRPDGGSIQIASPGTDELGATGLPGELDTHFIERFGASFLLSLIDGGLDIAAAEAQNNDNSTIINEGSRGFSRASELALQNSIAIPPTVTVAPGSKIQVFVAKDLDFSEGRR